MARRRHQEPAWPEIPPDELEALRERGLSRLPSVPPDHGREVVIGPGRSRPARIVGHAVLAPMSGVGDRPFRLLCRRAGASAVYGEFISSDGLVRDTGRSRKMMEFTDEERPIAIQVFGSDPEVVADAVRLVEDAGVDLVDLNFGCPVKKVIKREAGSALLKNPPLLAEICRAAADAAREVPVTAKIRSGWDSVNAVEIARLCEDNGADGVSIHARTQKMGYSGEADWSVIRDVKQAVSVPVIGNGDAWTPADALRMIDETGCDLVMIGRAARSEPWIFAGVNALAQGLPVPQPDWEDRLLLAAGHLALMLTDKRVWVAVSQFRSKLCNYVRGMPGAADFRRDMVLVDDPREAFRQLLAKAEELRGVIPDETVVDMTCCEEEEAA